MNYQFLPNADINTADILILPISYENTVSAKVGTKNAPQAILNATEEIEYYEEDLQWSPMKYMKISVLDALSTYYEISEVVSSLKLSDKKLLISLGGEHSITPEITKELLPLNATILFLDAHADLRASYRGNTYSHATPSYHLLAQGHKLIMVGVRSMFESEAIRVEKDKAISFYSDRELQKNVVKEKLLNEIKNISGDVYFSIDMDVFNPALVPGVGTPQPGGIDWYFATEIIETLFTNSSIDVKGVDIVELVPEQSNVSQIFAAKLMQKIISYWGKNKGFDNHEMSGSQTQVVYE